ncbi:response regulator [Pelomonas sp. SE-A7]|uniref:response regulator n=1 Tax=Pelomonas sp. SE-A7 TaxID=3054953 RepID=UPI00259CF515|nr:response regulator [Pelomonas sp. SE-A7]MDM4766320.1 response regulator [Pelomonas sp. SE-A7]
MTNQQLLPPLQADVSRLRALVIDEGELSRSVLSGILRQLGLQFVQSARRPEEARRMIRNAPQPYDLIVSDFHFRGEGPDGMTGQDLLDELRQARGLPMQTAFIMVTDEARYQHVADALEGALDDYLLKPITAGQFEDRFRLVMERKAALREVFQSIEKGDYDDAAARCEVMFAKANKFRVYAARIGSELYLRLNQLDAAKRMLEALLASKAVPWARLGLARIELSTADSATACRTLETLLAENPGYADAYDVYGRALLEEMKFDAAVEVFAKAVQITPGNVSRLQKLGSLELFLGQSQAAVQHLTAALNVGAQSRTLDYQGVVALAIASLDRGAEESGERAERFMQDAAMKHGDSDRVRRLRLCSEVAWALALRRYEPALSGLARLASELSEPAFSFEMACNLVMLGVRCAPHRAVPDLEAWVRKAAQRFSISRPRTRMLEMAASALPPMEQLVRETAGQINEASREAMSHLVNKQHGRTLQALVKLGESSLNARIINLAKATLDHHGHQLDASESLLLGRRIEALQEMYADAGRRPVERRA